MAYTLNTKKYFCAWLNKNPEVFLDFKNRNRLLILKAKNPSLQLTYIYHRSFLSSKAYKEMLDFCMILNIKPLNFEDIKPNTKLEEKLLSFAALEAQNWKNGTGGNPAGFSDVLRWCHSVLEQYGHYTDLDCQIDIEDLPEYIEVESPIVVQTGMHEGQRWFNNDLVAPAVSNGKLCKEALDKIVLIQKKLVERYISPVSEKVLNPGNCHLEKYASIFLNQFLPDFIHENKKSTIFDLRYYIQNMSVQEFLKHYFYKFPEHRKTAFKLIKDGAKKYGLTISKELNKLLTSAQCFPENFLLNSSESLLEETHGLLVLSCDKGKWLEGAKTLRDESRVFLQDNFIKTVYQITVKNFTGPAALIDFFSPLDGLAHTLLARRIQTPQAPTSSLKPDCAWAKESYGENGCQEETEAERIFNADFEYYKYGRYHTNELLSTSDEPQVAKLGSVQQEDGEALNLLRSPMALRPILFSFSQASFEIITSLAKSSGKLNIIKENGMERRRPETL